MLKKLFVAVRPQRQPCLFHSPEWHGQTNRTTQAAGNQGVPDRATAVVVRYSQGQRGPMKQ